MTPIKASKDGRDSPQSGTSIGANGHPSVSQPAENSDVLNQLQMPPCNVETTSVAPDRIEDDAAFVEATSPQKNKRGMLQIFRDALSVGRESLGFSYKASPGVVKSRMLWSAAQPFQFLAYGYLVEKLALVIKANPTNPNTLAILTPIVGAFLVKGVLDAFQGRANLAEALQQSSTELQIQEKIRELSPKRLERLNDPLANKDVKLVCWGGIYALTAATSDIMRAVAGTAAMLCAAVISARGGGLSAALFLTCGFLYPILKTYHLMKLQMSHEEEVAEKRTKATEMSWLRTFPIYARLYRTLGVQKQMDDKATTARNEVATMEKELISKKNLFNDGSSVVSSALGAGALYCLVEGVLKGSVATEVALFVGTSIVPMFFSSLDGVGSAFIALARGKPVLDAMRRLKEGREEETKLEGSEEIQWQDRQGARLTTKDVSFAYPTTLEGQMAVRILNNISIEIEPGTFVAIVGDNGAGKSTLLQLIERSYAPTSGEILINSTSIANVTDDNLFKKLKCLPQGAQQIDSLSLRELLESVRAGAGKEPNEKLLKEILSAIGFSKLLEKEVDGEDGKKIKAFPHGLDTVMGSQHHGVTLSTGERSLLYISCFLYSEPSMIVLDEPEQGLSEELKNQLFKTLRDVEKVLGYKPTIALVTHVLREAIRAEKVMYVKKGHSGIAGYGAHDELVDSNPDYAEWYSRSTTSKVE
jgi:ABC-type multidrug transport system fused ATPase/permease subunit